MISKSQNINSEGSLRRAVAARLAFTLATALFALALSCDRRPPQVEEGRVGDNETSSGRVGERLETKFEYALVNTFESGLKQLRGLAIDARDHVFLVGTEGVRVLDPEGKLLLSWRTSLPARCVAVDADGTAYVGLRTKVEKYDKAGKLILSWGAKGKGRGEFGVITAIALSDANVFVADAGNRCIHRFDTTGDFIDEIGKRDVESGFLGLICPSPYLDCVVAPNGELYVTNPGQLRVERYRIDGELLGHWGKPGTQPERFCGCCNPINLALTRSGHIVTAEKGIPRVKVYDAKGEMLAFIGPEFFSEEADGLDIAVDSAGRIYVTDPGDGKARVFERKE